MRATGGVKSSKRWTTAAIECHLCGLEDHDAPCTERRGEIELKQEEMKGEQEEEQEGMGCPG